MTKPVTTTPVAATHRWRLLAVVCLVQFMLMVDDTVVNVALPSIRDGLGFTPAGLPWVVNAYILAFGGLLVAAGRTGDRAGLVRTFVAGTAVFAVASLVCGLAQTPEHLVVARFAQGIGAALVSPTVLGLIAVVFTDGAERARAFAVWGTVAVTGGLSGVVLGGLITGVLSWRWVFLINLPVAAVALVLLPMLARGLAAGRRPEVRIGMPPAVLLIGAVGALAYGLLSLHSGGGPARPLTSLAVAAVLAVAFVAGQRAGSVRLIPPGLLADRARVVALIMGMLATGTLFGVFFTLTLQLQQTLSLSPVLAGLAYVPFAVGSFAALRLGPVLARRMSPGAVLTCAFGLVLTGALLLAGGVAVGGYPALLPGLVVFGFGVSAVLPATAQAAVAGVAPAEAGVSSGMVTSAQQLGGALGLAFAGVLLGAAGDRHLAAIVGAAVLATCALVLAATRPR